MQKGKKSEEAENPTEPVILRTTLLSACLPVVILQVCRLFLHKRRRDNEGATEA